MSTSYVDEQKLRLETLLNDFSVRQQSSAVPVMAEATGPAHDAPPFSRGVEQCRAAGPPSSTSEGK
jgi:hypothetical protein